MVNTKRRDALETLLRLVNAGRSARAKLTIGMLRALLTLKDRYAEIRKQLRGTGGYERLTCQCKLDRVVLTVWNLSWHLFKDLGYQGFAAKRLWGQNYRFVTRFRGRASIKWINVEFGPNASWLAPFRITIIPRDDSGVVSRDFQSIVELLPGVKLVLMEVAIDFPIGSVIDVAFVRRFLLSGKMWLPLGAGSDPVHQRWGAPTGSKALRAYVKWEASVTRVELELHAPFLRAQEIDDIFDFRKLADLLAKKHIKFGQIDEKKLVARLLREGIGSDKRRDILQEVRKREASLWEVLKYLRRTVHITNVQRLLQPFAEANQVMADALRKWASYWPEKPTKL